MRGALVLLEFRQQIQGIIPADAGSTIIFYIQDGMAQDHPRGCGEHYPQSLGTLNEDGSSPRMRGALELSTEFDNCLRIIPADAGSTAIRHWHLTPGPDHPRGCGEHVTTLGLVLRAKGSSPRMRGARHPPISNH